MDLKEWFLQLTSTEVLAMHGEVENPHLDCKVADPALSSSTDKKNLAICLSGFANAEGGVILWGVSARLNDKGIDCIDGHPGVDEPERLLSRLEVLTSQATSPGIVGVLHRITHAGSGEPTFVATYVPESESPPHMAKCAENRYYQRSGSSMMLMEHFQIADMFGRRPHPKLEIKAFPTGETGIEIELHNTGRGVAQAPYVMLNVTRPWQIAIYAQSGGNRDDFPFTRQQPGTTPPWEGAFLGKMDRVIHPGTRVRFNAITMPFTYRGPLVTRCTVDYKFGAAVALDQMGRFTYNSEAGQIIEISGEGYAKE
jgi:hypothetical protein